MPEGDHSGHEVLAKGDAGGHVAIEDGAEDDHHQHRKGEGEDHLLAIAKELAHFELPAGSRQREPRHVGARR
jgi:hypothetical protein